MASLTHLPKKADLLLFLLREELKCRKVFSKLDAAGFGENYFQPHLDELILECLGVDEPSDAVWERYSAILDKCSRKISDDRGSIMKQALKAYHQLMTEKQSWLAEVQAR